MAALRKLAKSTQRSRRSGSVAIEYALILPTLLVFVLGIIDMSRLLWADATLDRGVEAAARCAAVNSTTCGTASQIQSYAAAQAFGLKVGASAFTVSTPSCGIQVDGTYQFALAISAFVTTLAPVTLKVTACYPLAPPGGGGSSGGSGGHED